jgi:tRNA-2-methylthio-N6-dimethylallyladenosine synthase
MQSGSDRVLEKMNRTYTQTEYRALVNIIRQKLPTTTITTDIIVGFPTETEADFEETARLVEQAQFDSAYIFKYSERQGTQAARDFPDDVSEAVKTDRIVRLIERQRAISLKKHQAYIGKTVSVLIDGEAEKSPGHQRGKTDGQMTVIFPKTGLSLGAFVPVQIESATSGTLYGQTI